jgi:D-alanyl-D-alanine carboxypeptidase (penicillin-binding protein 5/6)
MRSLRRVLPFLALGGVIAASTVTAHAVLASRDDSRRHYLASTGWPSHGQAAFLLPGEPVQASPDERSVPIASVAKVMTAYLVLRAYPLSPGSNGFTMAVLPADVADTARRHDLDESIVKVQAGERLTERQALAALLLPSANNIAVMLAKLVAGSTGAFVATMNDMAHSLAMRHTLYTDPSGFDPGTRSTAADQVRLEKEAMTVPAFAGLVELPSYRIPVAGVVHNTDTILGRDGFIGTKTGSMDASGGCFMFAAHRVLDGRAVTLYGVVLGQPGHNLITAALTAARQLADQVAPVA